MKNAKPDGYTILIHHIGMATTPTLYRQLRFNPLTDFEYIGLINDVPMTIIAKPNVPAKDLKEFLAYIKANKDKVTYANAGIGAASHLCGMLFMSAIQTDLLTVPYKGTGPAMNDLLGGQVDFMCDQTTNTTSQIKSGKVKVYGVTSAQARRLAARRADAAGAGPEGRRGRHLARPVRAEGHAQAGDRQAGGRAAGGARRTPTCSKRFADLGASTYPAGQADAGRAAGAPQGRDRQVGAAHQEGRRRTPTEFPNGHKKGRPRAAFLFCGVFMRRRFS